MSRISIRIDRRTLLAESDQPLVAGSVGTTSFTMQLDQSWEGYTKTVIFTWRDRFTKESKAVLYTSGVMEVPWEVMAHAGELWISVTGIAEGKLRLTASMDHPLKIVDGGDIDAAMSAEATPELWQQVLTQVEAVQKNVEAVEEAASAAATSANEIQEALEEGREILKTAEACKRDAENARDEAEAAADRVTHSVSSVNRQFPDEEGNVTLSAEDVGAEPAGIAASQIAAAIGSEDAASGDFITLTMDKAPVITGMTVYGRSVQHGTPTPAAPAAIKSAGDSGTLIQAVTGKNFAAAELVHGLWTTNGVFYSHAGASSTYTTTKHKICLPKGDTYKILIESTNGSSVNLVLFYNGDAVAQTLSGQSVFTMPGNADTITVNFTGTAYTDGLPVTRFGIYLEDESDEFEPCGFASITTALPLCAVPVESGGNVTINGQQYIADVLTVNADGTGLVEKYCQIHFLDSFVNSFVTQGLRTFGCSVPRTAARTRGIWSKGPCSGNYTQGHGRLDANNFYVFDNDISTVSEATAKYGDSKLIYVLSTPLAIPLTPAEVQALLSLQCFTPVTNICNDAGAHQEVTYATGLRGECADLTKRSNIRNLERIQTLTTALTETQAQMI